MHLILIVVRQFFSLIPSQINSTFWLSVGLPTMQSLESSKLIDWLPRKKKKEREKN